MAFELNGLTMRGDRRAKVEALKPIINTSGAVATEEPLSPGARVFHEPSMNSHIVAVIGLKTPIDVQTFKDGLRLNLIHHPRFSSNFRSGKKTWVRTQVNLDDHIVVPNWDGDMESSDEFVDDYISNLTTTALDISKPLWEFHLLNIKTSDAEAKAVLKIHHSLGDGVSLISLLLACSRKASDPDSLPSLPEKKEVATSSHDPKGILRYVISIWFLCKVLWNTLVDVAVFLATALFLKDTHTPVKGSPGTEKKPKRIVHQILSLHDIKLVKNHMNATINDVLLGITQAGLSQYLNRRYGNIRYAREVEYKKDNLPENIRLRSTVMVNVRPSSGIQELANLMEKGSKCPWGNEIAYLILPFHIALTDDPLDHIYRAKATMDKKKQSFEAKCTFATSKLLLHLLGEKVVAALTYRLATQTTMSFSNMVGPVEEISMFSHPVAYIAPTGFGHPQALTIHFQSYVDKMTVVVAVDENVIPDPRVLCDDIAESLCSIKAALYKE